MDFIFACYPNQPEKVTSENPKQGDRIKFIADLKIIKRREFDGDRWDDDRALQDTQPVKR